MAHDDYKEGYLHSDHWALLRAQALALYGKQCYYPECTRIAEYGYFCELNHLNYWQQNHEDLSILVFLCQYHHWNWHEGALSNPYWILANQEKKLDAAGITYPQERIDWNWIRNPIHDISECKKKGWLNEPN